MRPGRTLLVLRDIPAPAPAAVLPGANSEPGIEVRGPEAAVLARRDALPAAPVPSTRAVDAPGSLRKVDIAQIPGSLSRLAEAGSGRLPSAATAPQVAARRTDVAEVDVPQLTSDRLALARTEMPDRVALRLGSTELGAVTVRISREGGMEVALSDLVDLVGGKLSADEFERFSGSAAANQFVGIDQLADAGIALSYNAAYDELQLALR